MSELKSGAPLLVTALRSRCPRCGEGPLFDGYLRLAPACTTCGLTFGASDTADGPAFFVMLPLGIITAMLALVIEATFEPPIWIHAVLLPTFIALAAGLALRPVKAIMVALQYRYRDVEDAD